MEPALALPQNPILQTPILQNPLPQEEDYQQSDGGANASRDSDDTLLLDEGIFNCENCLPAIREITVRNITLRE